MKRPVREPRVADVKDSPRSSRQPPIAVHVARFEARDLIEQTILVLDEIEPAAIGKEQPIERIERDEVHVFSAVRAEQREQLVDEIWRGDHGRPHVEREAVALDHARPAADPIQRFDYGYAISARSEANGSRQAAETSA